MTIPERSATITNGHAVDVYHNGHATNGANGHGERLSQADLMARVAQLKRERQAVLLAHNYQEGAIQDAADFVGDSLGLAQKARQTDAKVIVFAGVHFMAETAAMLCPDKTVLIPDQAAGCSLADMIIPEQVRAWRAKHPNGVVVCYVNTSAAVKAECDYCVTSMNGVKVIEHIPADKEVLFVPDYYLGSYLKAKTKRNIHLWKGYCPAHAAILPETVERLLDEHPEAEFLMHPECGCLTKQMGMADQILSTEGMVRYVERSPANEFVIATETGLLHRLQAQYPQRRFYPASEHAACRHMQRNTLEKVYRSLLTMQYVVTVDPSIAERAVRPIQRMLDIT